MCRKSRFWSLCAKFILATAKTCSSLVFISKKSCGKIFWDLFYRHRRILFQPHFFPPRKLVNSRRTCVLKNEVGLGIIIFPPPSNEKKMPCKLVTKKIIFLRKGKCFPIKVMDEEISDKRSVKFLLLSLMQQKRCSHPHSHTKRGKLNAASEFFILLGKQGGKSNFTRFLHGFLGTCRLGKRGGG